MPRQPWVTLRTAPLEVVRAYQIADSYADAVDKAFRGWADELGKAIEAPMRRVLTPGEGVAVHDERGEQAYRDLEGRVAKAMLGVWQESADEADKVFDKAFATELRAAGKAEPGEEPIAYVGETAVYAGDYVDPDRIMAATTYVQAEATRLVYQDVAVAQRRLIRSQIQRGIDTGIHPTTIARDIRQSVGVLPGNRGPYNEAMVERFRAAQADAGLSGAKLNKAVDRYRAKLVKRRAENIARTEMINAEAFSQRQTWRDRATRLGFDAEREWVADGKACPECALLDRTRAPLFGQYMDGSDGPAKHPSCRCAEALHPIRAR